MSEQAASEEASPGFPDLDLPHRLRNLRKVMREIDADGLIVSGPEVRRYIVGKSSAIAVLALDSDQAYAYQPPSLNPFKLPRSLQSLIEVQVTPDPLADAAVALRHCSAVGYESNTMTFESFERLKVLLPENIALRKIGNLAASVCAERDAGELARTKAAARTVAGVLDSVSERAYSLSEADLAAEIDDRIRESGASETLQRGQLPQIRPYVAFGPNSSDVTHSPGSAHLHHNDLAVLSAGAVIDGYWAVETRTLNAEKDSTMAALHGIVEDIFKHVKKLLESGESPEGASRKTMELLREAQLAGLAPHAPCFAIGMQLGDALCASGGDNTWTACIEPGLYVPGKGGIRIGQTEVIAATLGPHPAAPMLAVPSELSSVTPYFRTSSPAFADFPDRHTAFLIGDFPASWDGGI